MPRPPRRRHRIAPEHDSQLSAGERALIVQAAIHAIEGLPRPSRGLLFDEITRYLGRYPLIFGEDIPLPEEADEDLPTARKHALLAGVVAHLRRRLVPLRPTALDRRIAWLAQHTGLTPLDRLIAGVLARSKLFEPWRPLLNASFDFHERSLRPIEIATALGLGAGEVRARLAPGRPLLLGGVVDRDHEDGVFSASDFLARLARLHASAPARLAAEMLQPAPRSSLAWEDFAHLGADRTVAEGLIGAAARRREGVNLLLHGVPGTGKSEFARALADRLGLRAIFAGRSDEDGDDPTRSERLAHFTVARALTRRSREYLIVVDEAEDVMLPPGGDARTRHSKLWLNHLIEQATGPTVWIVNDLDTLGAPVIRRMSAAIGFPLPPPAVRERVAARHADRAGLVLDAEDRRRIGRLEVPPAVAAQAVRAAALTDRRIATMERVAAGLGAALGARPHRAAPPEPLPFDPALSRADRDLEALAGQIAAAGERRWSLLLEGAPGTGKSAYARHLADRLGLELIERRGSDLLGAFVGETEAKIAAAFAEAAERHALLLFDEADALLRDRRGAARGWEVSMTNEMLAWMERHPAPFAVTTNLSDTLDPATTRRFLFRIRFEPLDAVRAAMLWEGHFGDRPPAGLAEVDGLTPADFALVARRVAITGEAAPAQRLAMLAAEAAAKPGVRRRLGFGVPTPGPRLANDRAA